MPCASRALPLPLLGPRQTKLAQALPFACPVSCAARLLTLRRQSGGPMEEVPPVPCASSSSEEEEHVLSTRAMDWQRRTLARGRSHRGTFSSRFEG